MYEFKKDFIILTTSLKRLPGIVIRKNYHITQPTLNQHVVQYGLLRETEMNKKVLLYFYSSTDCKGWICRMQIQELEKSSELYFQTGLERGKSSKL